MTLQDVDMNLNELEEALQQINGQLMTDKEMQYVYHVCICVHVVAYVYKWA